MDGPLDDFTGDPRGVVAAVASRRKAVGRIPPWCGPWRRTYPAGARWQPPPTRGSSTTSGLAFARTLSKPAFPPPWGPVAGFWCNQYASVQAFPRVPVASGCSEGYGTSPSALSTANTGRRVLQSKNRSLSLQGPVRVHIRHGYKATGNGLGLKLAPTEGSEPGHFFPPVYLPLSRTGWDGMTPYRDLPGPVSWGATPRIRVPLLAGRQAPPSQGLAEGADK